MRRSLNLFALVLVAATASYPQSRLLYVSPNGNDAWSGSLPSPNTHKTDGPLATFNGARTALRRLAAHNKLPFGATVQIRRGTYNLDEGFILTAEDSGTSTRPMLWRAHPGEHVQITGGRVVRGFVPVIDPDIRRRLSPAARARVVVADVRSQGITSFGELAPRGGPPMELFFKGKRMMVARYPNNGWLRIADVPQRGDSLYNKGLEREKRFDGVPAGRHFGRITYAGTRPSSWLPAGDVYLHGYWTFDWSDSYQRVSSIDTVQKEITLLPPHHHYGYTKNQRYYVLNVLEELDSPGEWYLDRSQGLLYFWPPTPIPGEGAVVSLLEKPLVSITDAAWIRLEGLSFAFSRGKGIVITGGHDVVVDRCVFQALGREAVTIEGGRSHGVISSDIHDVALGGILLRGGDRKLLVPGSHYSLNNHIHHYSTWLRTGQYAVVMDGVGHRIANNLIHDSPFEGVYVKGNDHLLEYNEFHHLMKETGDAGAIHTGRDWTWRGNVIRYNYFHDLQGPGLHGVMAVYLDDWASGFTVFGNLFYRAGRATLIGGGRDNTVENNIYVACSPSIHVDARGRSWASYYFDGTERELSSKLDAMNYTQPPYSTRYPELLRLYDDEPTLPKYNRIVRNISYGGRWMDVYDYQAFDFSLVTVSENLIADPILLRRRADGLNGWDPYYLNIDLTEGYVALSFGDSSARDLFRGNTFVEGNPGIVAAEKGNFTITKGSPAQKLGIRPVPVHLIGLKRENRTDRGGR